MSKILLTKKQFKEVMEVLKFAAKDEVRPILQGVCFNNDEVVAIDGYRMAIRKLPTSIDGSCVIHQNDLKNILKLVKKEVENIEIEFDLKYSTFKLLNKNNEVINELFGIEYLCGNFSNYKNLLLDEKKVNGTIKINSKELLDIIKPLKKNYQTYFKLKEDTLEIFELEKQDLKNTHKKDVKHKLNFIGKIEIKNLSKKNKNINEDIFFALNSTYIKDSIKNYDEFKLSFVDKLSPFVIEDLEENKYDMLLPLRMFGEYEFVY